MGGRVRIERDGAIGWLVFDHPERRNAISVEMWRQIPGLAQELANDANGYAISPDLRGRAYENETLIFLIPPEIEDRMFDHVSVWCTSFPDNYGYARLFPGAFPN